MVSENSTKVQSLQLDPAKGFAARLGKLIDDVAEGNVSRFVRMCEEIDADAAPSHTMVRKYKEGGSPTLDKLVVMADAAKVSVEWLATGKENRVPGAKRSVDDVLLTKRQLDSARNVGIIFVDTDTGADFFGVAFPDYLPVFNPLEVRVRTKPKPDADNLNLDSG